MLTSNFVILPLMEVSVKSGEGQSFGISHEETSDPHCKSTNLWIA